MFPLLLLMMCNAEAAEEPVSPALWGAGLELGLGAGVIREPRQSRKQPWFNRPNYGLIVTGHFSETFAVDVQIFYALEVAEEEDKKPTPSHKSVNYDCAREADVSRPGSNGSVAFSFSPIHGDFVFGRQKFAFSAFGSLGAGMVRTLDSLEALCADEDDDEVVATQNQWHPTTVVGGGLRVQVNHWFSLRFEGRRMLYIEVLESSTLEMKNPLILQLGTTIFL